MKKNVIFISLLVVAILILTACSPQNLETTPTPISTQPAGILAEGSLHPNLAISQVFTASGLVTEVLVTEGDLVEKGQVLAELEIPSDAVLAYARAEQEVESAQQALDALQRNAETNLAQAKSNLFNTQEELTQTQDLFEEENSEENEIAYNSALAAYHEAEDTLQRLEEGEGIDPDVLAAAETRLSLAELAMENTQAILDSFQLKASIAGNIVNNTLKIGQTISAGNSVMEIVDFSPWLIKTNNLTELEISEINLGQQAKVVFDALPEKTYTATVSEIATQYEEKRGDITYTVTLVLQENDPDLRWGLTAAVTFKTN